MNNALTSFFGEIKKRTTDVCEYIYTKGLY